MYIEDLKGVCESSGGREEEEEQEEIFSVVASGGAIGLSGSKRVLVGAGARALFYPTLVYNVVRNKFQADFRWWDQIDEFLLLGAVPFPRDVKRLKDLGVHGVITLNEPYETLVPTALYKAHGIDHLVLPTRDYLFAPSIDDICEAVNFIHGKTLAKQGTYVHCKAGRGRSTTIVICYLIQHRHMSPAAAYAYVRSIRPRVLLASAQRQAVEEYYHLKLKVKKRQQGSRDIWAAANKQDWHESNVMGSGFSQHLPCFNPTAAAKRRREQPELIFTPAEPLDETLGHSFCYVRSSARFLSPTHSDRFISPSQSLRFSPSHESSSSRSRQPGGVPETGFKAISGASVSANTSTPRTVLQLENIYDDATDSVGGGIKSSIVNGFESTSSFSALPLQPVPRGDAGTASSGPMERAFFMSGPIERGALSGPLDCNIGSDSGNSNRVPFSAPLNGGIYVKKKRKKGIPGMRKAFHRNFPPPWVVPVRNFVSSRKENANASGRGRDELDMKTESDVQWALGKAGEDRVHVVVSEEHGWLFVGIYDGFNGPDAPEFLMGNLYKAMYKELEGLFWDSEEAQSCQQMQHEEEAPKITTTETETDTDKDTGGNMKKVTFQSGGENESRRKRLWEYLAQEELEDGLDLSGSERFAFSVDDALNISKTTSGVSKRSVLLSKLKNGFNRHKESGRLFAWRFGLDAKEHKEVENRIEERSNTGRGCRMKKIGPVDHDLVLKAMSRALEVTELAYLDMTDKVMDQYPELALMGSCLLVALMRDEDVYVMNLGDSRAIVAQHEEPQEVGSSGDNGAVVEGIIESKDALDCLHDAPAPAHDMKLMALQLSTDHSTSIEDEVTRIKKEHPDDNQCIVNGRVKGRLKVTRAFGAGFLKKPKWNDSLLEMFRNEYIGTEPYVSCEASVRHHHLCPRDQFLVLSSDGLYQYFSNQEVVSHVQIFMEKFPDGDPAQHLIEELLLRAAKKAGMDLHELLDIPQGDRRKYHDDVTVMVISLEGRIWKSSGKYL